MHCIDYSGEGKFAGVVVVVVTDIADFLNFDLIVFNYVCNYIFPVILLQSLGCCCCCC